MKKIELFDLCKMIFEGNEKFHEISDYEKSKHFFMVNRLMAKNFPIQSFFLNIRRINAGNAVNAWEIMLRGKYKTTPKWFFQKSKIERLKTEKNKILEDFFSELVLQKYCEIYSLSRRELSEAFRQFPEELIVELRDLEKNLSE